MNDKSALLPVLAALTALGSAACFKTEAKTPAAMPALTVPAPPSRTLVPSTIEPEEPVPPPPNLPNAPVPVPKPETPATPPRTASPPTSPPPTPPPANSAEPPPPVVQAASTVTMKEMVGRVNKTLAETEPMLEKLKAAPLSREATDQLITAWNHVRAAKEALSVNNILFANELAQKALTLAKQLGGGKQ